MRFLRKFFFSTALIGLFSPLAAFGQSGEFAPLPQASPLQAVNRAKVLLEEKSKERSLAAGHRIVYDKSGPQDIVLAVWNPYTDVITLVEAKKRDKILTVSNPSGLTVKVVNDNGVNTHYQLPFEKKSVVVGQIYPIFVEITAKRRRAYELKDVIYVPYSPDLYVPEILAAGSDYLSYLIKDAYDDLRAKKIRSRAFSDRLLADVIDPYLIKSIVVIEHSDHRIFLGENPERAMGKLLVSLATNKDEAFGFSVSRAGARGLVQFIPSTYNRLARSRPELGLNLDFTAGMTEHRNAVKAQVALLDAELAAMPTAVRKMHQTDMIKVGELLAAAYNGGSPRIKKAFNSWGEDWAKSYQENMDFARNRTAVLKDEIKAVKKKLASGTKKNKAAMKKELSKLETEREIMVSRLSIPQKRSLRKETVLYVAKLKIAYNMFTSGFFATPSAPSGALPQQALSPAASQGDTGRQVADFTVPSSHLPSGSDKICFSDGNCLAFDLGGKPTEVSAGQVSGN